MKTFAIVLIAITVIACSVKDNSKDKVEMKILHDQAREAHVSKNAAAMVEGFADNFLSVNRGKIDSLLSKEQHRMRFQNYFDAVTFKKWDDLNPPVIRFSDDRSLAYTVVDKLVVLETKDSLGNRIEATTHFAWTAIFRKQKTGDWKLECVTSTNEPEMIKSL